MTKKEPLVYTANDVEAFKKEYYWQGMANCHQVTYSVIQDLIESLEDVQSIYYLGDVVGKKAVLVEQMQTAIDTLIHLTDVFQAKYDDLMNESKKEERRKEAEELRDSLAL